MSNAPLKIALIGKGRMGSLLKELAPSLSIDVVKIFDSKHPLEEETNPQFSLIIDFSTPLLTRKHVEWAKKHHVHLVIGTTGWLKEYETVKSLITKEDAGVLYSPNYSLGMLLFAQVINYSASLFQKYPEFSPSLFERHHKEKKDAPSGTLSLLSDLLEKNQLEPTVCSERAGYTVGYHELIFESKKERVSLSHEAFDRESFAKGALLSALWLVGKKGFFTAEEIVL